MSIGAIRGGVYPSTYNVRRVEQQKKSKPVNTSSSSPHVEQRIEQLTNQFERIGLYNNQGAKVVAQSIASPNLNIVA